MNITKSSRQSGYYSDRARLRIVLLHENGLSATAIAKEVGSNVTRSRVWEFCFRNQEAQRIQNKEGKGPQQMFMVKE